MSAPLQILRPEISEAIDRLKMLRAPFAPHQISKLPKETKAQADQRKADRNTAISCKVCGGWHHKNAVHLDYVGHAALTDRLLDVDPAWSWEPAALTPEGLPAFDRNGGLWIKLTVCNVTRMGYGAADGKTGGDAVKEVIGDALRNAAMRFGAALDLWHKGDLHVSDDDEKPAPANDSNRRPDPANTAKGADAPKTPTLAERADRLEKALRSYKTADDLRKAYSLASGLCADLDDKDPERLAEIETLYAERFDALSNPVSTPKNDFDIGDDEIPY